VADDDDTELERECRNQLGGVRAQGSGSPCCYPCCDEARLVFIGRRGWHVDAVIDAAEWAHGLWRRGQRVLIRCQAGLNRSGLVTALVLLLDGWDPADAIEEIRTRRSPWALCNQQFADWLLDEAPSALAARQQHLAA